MSFFIKSKKNVQIKERDKKGVQMLFQLKEEDQIKNEGNFYDFDIKEGFLDDTFLDDSFYYGLEKGAINLI